MDFITILLAVVAAGMVGFEIGRHVAMQKVHMVIQQMTDSLTEATKKIQESKGGTAG